MAFIFRLSSPEEIVVALGTTWISAEVMQVAKSLGIFGGDS